MIVCDLYLTERSHLAEDEGLDWLGDEPALCFEHSGRLAY